jgi:hypothetical protein
LKPSFSGALEFFSLETPLEGVLHDGTKSAFELSSEEFDNEHDKENLSSEFLLSFTLSATGVGLSGSLIWFCFKFL